MPETEDREEFLSQANVAILTSVGKGARPHAAPIWYLYEEGVIVMSSGSGSQKHRNIQRNPEVTLVVDRRTLPYYALIVQGRVEIGPPLSEEQLERMAVRYLGEDLAKGYLAMRRAQGGESVSLRLLPRKVIEFKGAAGRR